MVTTYSDVAITDMCTSFWIAGHGMLPFKVADVVRRCILIAFPIISLWLPSLMR
jgi:hypothetical protein